MDPETPPAPAAATPRTRWLLLLGLAVATAFVGLMLSATEAHVVAQVSDLYLVCQYAKAMAEGHAFQYNAGEAGSTGATSLLFTAVLAAAYALGAHGEGLVAVAILLGIGCYLASIELAARIGAMVAGPAEGTLAGAMIALGGPVAWGFLYGSDIAPYMLLTLWLLHGFLIAWRDGRGGPVLVPGVLLALTRPEGLPIAALIAAALAWRARRTAAARLPLAALAPVGAGLAVLAVNRWKTGFWLGTSLADKSLFANYATGDAIGLLAEYGTDVVRGLLLGFYPAVVPVGLAQGWSPYYFAPLALLLVLLALVDTAEPVRQPLQVFAAIVAAVWLLFAPNMFLGVHFNRYLMWAFPVLHVLTAVGLGIVTRRFAGADERLRRDLFRGTALVVLTLAALATARFAALYGSMAGEMWRRDVAAARWITRNLPAGVPMANVATSVEFLTGHRALNLHGVTTPAFFGNRAAERDAGVIESLARLPGGERPPFLITTTATQEGRASMRTITDGPPLYQSSSLGDEILIFRTRYDALDRARQPLAPASLAAVAGLQPVGSLNVCDSADEAAHAYRYSSRLAGLPLYGTARVEASGGEPLADSGRAIIGSESFDVRAHAGRDLVIVMRTASEASALVRRAKGSQEMLLAFPDAAVVVSAGGQPVGRIQLRPQPGWDEGVITIPAAFVKGDSTRITLEGRYASFRYWFFQPPQ